MVSEQGWRDDSLWSHLPRQLRQVARRGKETKLGASQFCEGPFACMHVVVGWVLHCMVDSLEAFSTCLH
eukprot:1158379-Pelagomonas_calceolata.AAC.10